MKSIHISNTGVHHDAHNFSISNPDPNPNPNPSPSFLMSKLPTKYKYIKLRRQIWPLFKQEYYNTNSTSKIYSKVDINPKLALGYTYSKPITHHHTKYTPNHVNVPAVRRSSPNAAGQYPCQRSKSVIFTDVSMQRDSVARPLKFIREEETMMNGRDNNIGAVMKVSVIVPEDEDQIPIGMVICKSHETCNMAPHLGMSPSEKSDPLTNANVLMSARPLNILGSRSRIPTQTQIPKRTLERTSPDSSSLCIAIEREFTRLGITYKSQDPKAHPTSSTTVMHNYHANVQELIEESADISKFDQKPAFPSDVTVEVDDAQWFGEISNRTESLRFDLIDSNAFYADPTTLPDMDRFAQLIRKAEVSLRRFTAYLIKAKHKALRKENPDTSSSSSSSSQHIKDKLYGALASMIEPDMAMLRFVTPGHFRYGLQACVNAVVFDRFDTVTYGAEKGTVSGEVLSETEKVVLKLGEEVSQSGKVVLESEKGVSEEFGNVVSESNVSSSEYFVLEALCRSCTSGDHQLNVELNSDFKIFCYLKLESMKKRIGWVTRWPSKLVEVFGLCLIDVWIAHKLAFSVERPPRLFCVETRTHLNLDSMNPLVVEKKSCTSNPYNGLDPTWSDMVQFSVFPGFDLGPSSPPILRSIVYLKPKAQGITPRDFLFLLASMTTTENKLEI